MCSNENPYVCQCCNKLSLVSGYDSYRCENCLDCTKLRNEGWIRGVNCPLNQNKYSTKSSLKGQKPWKILCLIFFLATITMAVLFFTLASTCQ